MRNALLLVVVSGLLATAAFPAVPSAVVPLEGEKSAAGRPPGKLGRWFNRRTRPLGRTLEKVTPFRLAKQPPHGIGGCCFPADTRIALPGGRTCAIGKLRLGQAVLGWNPATGALDTARVEALAAVVHDSLRRLSFADGRTVAATVDHPFWVHHVGWASLAPAQTAARYTTGPVHRLQPGDSCLVFTGTARPVPTRLRSVTALTACGVPTYTITRLGRGTVFFANGVAVGVEGKKSTPSRPQPIPSGQPLVLQRGPFR